MNSAIIVAAGESNRFGGDTPKQFIELLGKPVLVHTMDRFQKSSAIDEIILVVSGVRIRACEDMSSAFGISKLAATVAGGETRTQSVLNGLKAASADDEGIVAIHDGARPVVPQSDIRECVEAADRTGASCLVAPIIDTVKRVKGNLVAETLDRSELRRALTPQCFRYRLIRDAYREIGNGVEMTDDSVAAEVAGIEVSAVEGSPLNVKLTFESDLAVVETNLRALLDSED